MRKRVLAFVTFVCMMVSIIPMVGVYAFSDVTEETPYRTAIEQLEEWGKIEGYGDGTYRPEELITRAEFVKMLMSLEENSGIEYVTSDAETGFIDIDNQEEPHWAAQYIQFAVYKKVINGYEDGSFRPDNQVTYEEALKMVVCLLGYELKAVAKAEASGLELWPNGYIAVASELSITQSITMESFSAEVTRGVVAQIIYNASKVQQVDPNTQQPVTVGGATSAVSGGSSSRPSGGGGGGGGGGGSNVISPNNTYVTYGVIVGTNDTFIDDAAYLENNGRISSAYMVFKEDKSGNYFKLYTGYKAGDAGYTSMIGYRVKLTYKEIDDISVDYQVVKVDVKDTQVITVDAEDIFKLENNTFYYSVLSNGKWVTRTIKYDIANMQFMYNGSIVRNANGTTENMAQMMSDDDLKPEVGSVKLVDTDGNGVADFAVIESYTTIVVDECKTESVQENPNDTNSKYKRYTIKDKFAKEGEGEEATQKVYTFDDRKLVDEKGDTASPSISAWDVVYLAQPKDLSKTIIRISSKSTSKTITVFEIDTNGYSITENNTSKTVYTTSQYFLNNVWETIKEEALESGVKLVLYMDPSGKIAAAQIGEPSYTVGYLINAAMDMQKGDLILRIVTSSNKTKADAQQYAISSTAKINGKAVGKEEILQMLKDNALPVQEGKPEHMMVNADMAQPIRFEVSGISKNTNLSLIKNLDIISADPEFLFQADDTAEHGAKRYINASEKGFGNGISDIAFTVSSSATVFLLPNNRLETEYFKIGTLSSLSKYLIANESYNVEPYIVQYADGTKASDIVVIYYEDTYAAATVNSPVAIVKEIKDGLDTDGQSVKKIETISASVSASTSSSMTYTVDPTEVTSAKYYGAAEDDPTYEVKPGDIITFGYKMDDKNICNIQILFDVSERNNVNQQKHLQLKASGSVHIDDETEAYYRVALGKITSIPDGTSSQMRAKIYIEDDSISESLKNISINVNNKTIYGYDPEDSSDKPSSVDEDNKTLKFMDYAEVGDFVFIFQTSSTERYTYVVKNRDIITGTGESETGNEQLIVTSGDADTKQDEEQNSEEITTDENMSSDDALLPTDETLNEDSAPTEEAENEEELEESDSNTNESEEGQQEEGDVTEVQSGESNDGVETE